MSGIHALQWEVDDLNRKIREMDYNATMESSRQQRELSERQNKILTRKIIGWERESAESDYNFYGGMVGDVKANTVGEFIDLRIKRDYKNNIPAFQKKEKYFPAILTDSEIRGGLPSAEIFPWFSEEQIKNIPHELISDFFKRIVLFGNMLIHLTESQANFLMSMQLQAIIDAINAGEIDAKIFYSDTPIGKRLNEYCERTQNQVPAMKSACCLLL